MIMIEEKEVIPYHLPYPLPETARRDIRWKIDDVIISGQLTNGEKVRELEEKVKELYNVEYCIATSSCTTGLMICLEYIKLPYIQLPAFNWKSVQYIIEFLKINPWYTDIDEKTWLSEEGYQSKSLYVHTFGNVGISDKEDAIYDASHAFGALLPDIGQATVFSLAPTKLVTSCEGGLIITNDRPLYEFAKERRDKMCRMSEVHAIIGLQTLLYLDRIKEWKAKVYNYYKKNIPYSQFQEVHSNSSYNTIGFLNLDNLRIPDHISYKQYYEPIHRGLKNTEYVYEKIVCLPSYFNCPYSKVVTDILEANDL
jgi:dTDP-4-amino-4,6-dideoxygalactose transaminase